MNSLRYFINKRHAYIAAGIVIAALVLKYFYIFHCTSFRDSLWCDMWEYWHDSFQRAWGDRTAIEQWGNFPPFYKYFCLAPFFKVLKYFGCLSHALVLIVLANILLYGISSCVFYLIARRLIANRITVLIALLFYSFSYLALYVNALVMPDSLGISLTVVSTGMIIFRTDRISVLMAGLFLGLAIALKPLLLFFGPVFMGYIFLKNDKRSRAWTVMIFTAALVIAPLMTVAENFSVSHGRLKSIGATGGLNFLQGWGKVKRVCNKGVCIGSPGAFDEPGWRSLEIRTPSYEQGYFYRLGLNAIIQNPGVLVEKIFWFKKLFWGLLGPPLRSPPEWYDQIMPPVQDISYVMFISLGMLGFLAGGRSGGKDIYFLFSLLISFMVFIYIFGLPERRYFLNIEFLVIALFFVVMDRAMALYRIYRNEIRIYALVVFAFFICVPYELSAYLHQ